MNLLIDMGNTRLKWAVTTDGQITVGTPLLNTQINRQELINLWTGNYRPRRVAISCVTANQLLERVETVASELWLDVEIIRVKSQAQAFGVINAYREPEKLGIDRWLALVAVWQRYQGSVCIVDCGTAITVDVIDAKGRHQGGLISPGLMLMKKSLALGTEALDVNGVPFTVACLDSLAEVPLADNTETAIYKGSLTAAVGMIEHVLAQQSQNMLLVLTGGDATLIAKQLDIAVIVDPDLVLQGLLCVLEGHA